MKFPEYTVVNHQQKVEILTIRFEINLSPELDFFDGHFDQLAILPAVAQLFMVKKLADLHLEISGSFVGLRQLKFKSPVSPNPATDLFIEYSADSGQLFFKFEHLGQLKSKGVFQFENILAAHA